MCSQQHLMYSCPECRLCFALALWNEKDPILKERLFGLTGPEVCFTQLLIVHIQGRRGIICAGVEIYASQGNHGEDVKEWYLLRSAFNFRSVSLSLSLSDVNCGVFTQYMESLLRISRVTHTVTSIWTPPPRTATCALCTSTRRQSTRTCALSKRTGKGTGTSANSSLRYCSCRSCWSRHTPL